MPSVTNKPFILCVIVLSVIMLNVIMMSVVMLNVIMLNVIMMRVIMLNVIMMSVVMLNIVALSGGHSSTLVKFVYKNCAPKVATNPYIVYQVWPHASHSKSKLLAAFNPIENFKYQLKVCLHWRDFALSLHV
jgi:hypothetical protein